MGGWENLGRWLDSMGCRYDLRMRRYDDRNKVPGRLSQGYWLMARDAQGANRLLWLTLSMGDMNEDLFQDESGHHLSERRARFEGVLAAAFRQAVFLRRVQPKQEAFWTSEDCPLRLTGIPDELHSETEPEFSFEKDETYLIQVARAIQMELLRVLRPEYRDGMDKGRLLEALRLEEKDINRELDFLKRRKLLELRTADSVDVVVSITEEGLDWLSTQEQADLPALGLQELLASGKDEFILPAGEAYRAKLYVLRVMQLAKERLAIVDEYLDDSVFDMLGAIPESIEVTMLTGSRKPMFKPLLDGLKANRDKVDARENPDFHDRFLIVDDKDVWQLGCSINGLGRGTSRLGRVRNDEERKRLLDLHAKSWENGTAI